MSDLNCGCGCDSCDNRIGTRESCGCGCGSTWGMGNGNSCLWIILLLIFCGNNGCGSTWNRSGDCDCGNNSCLWIILLLIFCGGCGNNGCF